MAGWNGAATISPPSSPRSAISSRPSFLMMLREILRFNRMCLRRSRAPVCSAMSIGDYLDWRGFSPGFTQQLPGADGGRDLVDADGQDAGFSGRELHPVLRQSPADLFQAAPVAHGDRRQPQLSATSCCGRSATVCISAAACARSGVKTAGSSSPTRGASTKIFDKVIIAAHSDQALAMLSDATPAEKRAPVGRSLPCPTASSAPRHALDAEAARRSGRRGTICARPNRADRRASPSPTG